MSDVKVYNNNNNKNNKGSESQTKEKEDQTDENKDNADFAKLNTLHSTKIISDEKKNNNKLKISMRKKMKMNYVGSIEDAIIHSNANRPLRRLGEFNSQTVFCKCCGLPCEQKGVMEKYSFEDSTEEFIKHGQVISLYFSFYVYSMYILLYIFLAISLPTLIITNEKSKELNKICNKIPNKNSIEECNFYRNDIENSTNISSILDFSGLNIKNYRKIYKILTSNDNKIIDGLTVNYSALNFICLITILIFNFGYILLLYNKTFSPDEDIITPRKYSIIITELEGFYSFLKEKKFVLDKDNNSNNADLNEAKLSPTELEVKKGSERIDINNSVKQEINEISGVEKFKNLFKEKISELFLDKIKNFNVNQVNICFKIHDYLKQEGILEKCNERIEKIENLPYQKQKNEESDLKGDKRNYYYAPLSNFNIHWFEKAKNLDEIKKEKKKAEDERDKLLNESKEINMDKFAGAVIVSFNTIKEKEEFLSNISNTFIPSILRIIPKLRYFFCFCCLEKVENWKFLKNINIQIEEAPEPEDIIFENLEFTSKTKAYRVVGMNMISLLLIGIGFGIIFGFQNLQIYVNKKNYKRIIYYLISLCITIVTSIINIIFEELLDFLTKTEKQKSITNYYLSYSVKLALFSFLTSGIIPLVCEAITDTQNYEILISNMIVMFLVNSIISPLLWTFSPKFLLKRLLIYLIEKNKLPDLYYNLNQKELNKLYELSDMNIAYKYAYIAKTLLMTFFYISIFPFGALISLIGFFFCYFLEKYNYITIYKRPEMLNNTLFIFYVNNFIYFLFFYAVGDFIFLSDIYSNKGWSLANIIIFGILLVAPYQLVLNHDFVGFKETEINSLTFDEAYLEFYTDYERANPMTKKEGMIKYIEKLFEIGKIDKKSKENFLKNIENINLMKVYYENRQNVNLIKIQKNLAPHEVKILKNNATFKASINKKFKLSVNYNTFKNYNLKQTMPLRGESKKEIDIKELSLRKLDKESKDKKEKKEKKEPRKRLVKFKEVEKDEEKKEIKEKEEESKTEKTEKDKDIIKDVEIDVEEQEQEDKEEMMERAKATKHFRDYYKDPILLRMANSMRVAEIMQSNQDKDDSEGKNEESGYNFFSKIDENEGEENGNEDDELNLENLEVENSRIDFGGNLENEENEESEESKEKEEIKN